MNRNSKIRRRFVTEAKKDDDGVIKKVGNKWRIKGKKQNTLN